MLALTLASLDGNIVGPALPRIVSDLGGLSHLAWVVTAFSVASTAATPLYGKLSDQFGRKPAFFVSIGIFLAGSVLCALSRSMVELIVFRAVQGIGARRVADIVADDDCRSDITAGTRAVSGAGGCGVCRVQRGGSVAGRGDYGSAELALDLLHQPACRVDCAGLHRDGARAA